MQRCAGLLRDGTTVLIIVRGIQRKLLEVHPSQPQRLRSGMGHCQKRYAEIMGCDKNARAEHAKAEREGNHSKGRREQRGEDVLYKVERWALGGRSKGSRLRRRRSPGRGVLDWSLPRWSTRDCMIIRDLRTTRTNKWQQGRGDGRVGRKDGKGSKSSSSQRARLSSG